MLESKITDFIVIKNNLINLIQESEFDIEEISVLELHNTVDKNKALEVTKIKGFLKKYKNYTDFYSNKSKLQITQENLDSFNELQSRFCALLGKLQDLNETIRCIYKDPLLNFI